MIDKILIVIFTGLMIFTVSLWIILEFIPHVRWWWKNK